MIVDNIEVIEPSLEARDIKPGTNKTVEYRVKNIGDHPLIDFEVIAQTIKKVGINEKTGEPILQNTDKNYSRVISKPTEIQANKEGIIKVEIKVPYDYNEVVKNNSGRLQRTPFRLKLSIHSLEDIKEL